MCSTLYAWLLMNRHNKTESRIFISCLISLLPKDLLLELTCLHYSWCLVPCGGPKKPPVLHSADDIFWSIGISELSRDCYWYAILLKDLLGGAWAVLHYLLLLMYRLNKTESGIFISLNPKDLILDCFLNEPRQANLCLRAFRHASFNCACPAIQRG